MMSGNCVIIFWTLCSVVLPIYPSYFTNCSVILCIEQMTEFELREASCCMLVFFKFQAACSLLFCWTECCLFGFANRARQLEGINLMNHINFLKWYIAIFTHLWIMYILLVNVFYCAFEKKLDLYSLLKDFTSWFAILLFY